MYKCKECGKEAILLQGELIRACNCKCGVVTDMEAVCVGNG